MINSQQYLTFEDWWNEIEGFAIRSERFHESMTQFSNTGKLVNLELWLQAAFEAGQSSGAKTAPSAAPSVATPSLS
jgi:hypothetical protein